jgi:mycothiol synthase
VLTIRIDPPEVHEQLGETEALTRLVSGDALDQAMFGSAMLGMVVDDARQAGATSVEMTVMGAGDVHQEMAEAQGLVPTREILRMGRDLPLDVPWELDVRPFVVGRDEAAWLEVNNRAFAWHPDQHDQTMADITAGEAEPWFDPEGFLLHEIDGRLAGFCWTKIHADERPPLGEIYVIGVDPDFHGRGLGRQLVLAGLDWLSDQGLRDGILYVEHDNDPAVHLYRKLGFDVLSRDRWWRIEL